MINVLSKIAYRCKVTHVPKFDEHEQTVIRRAKELLSDRRIKGALATTDSGNSVSPESPFAAKFCLIGALRCERHKLWEATGIRVSNLDLTNKMACYVPTSFGESLARFNDNDRTTDEDVQDYLTAVIETFEVKA